jgi:hypothetical protein
MPLTAAITIPILPDLAASWTTPHALELMTVVGPPDCATITFGFEAILITPICVVEALIKLPVLSKIYNISV